MGKITINLTQEVNDLLDFFCDTLAGDDIHATREEIAGIFLVDWAAKYAAEVACYGRRKSHVPIVRPQRMGRTETFKVDTYLLFDFLRSDYCMEIMADPDMVKQFRKFVAQAGDKEEQQALVDAADRDSWS